MSILIFLALLSILIIAHELGHFSVAKWCGMRVERFGFGLPFGPTLWSKKIGETEYCIHAALLGGYVGFPDDNPDSDIPKDSPERFENQPLLNRFLVAIAGVTVNAILAWLLMTVVVMGWGLDLADVTVDKTFEKGYVLEQKVDGEIQKTVTEADSPATVAGLKSGDVFLAVNGKKLAQLNPQNSINFVKKEINSNPLKPITVTVDRAGETKILTMTPDENGKVGLMFGFNPTLYKPDNIMEASSLSVRYLSEILAMNLEAFGNMFSGKVPFDEVKQQLSGPVEIVAIGSEAIDKVGFHAGLHLAAIISLILAFMNLLPIPALDGGHILFMFIEFIRGGKPLNRELQEKITMGGVVVLMALMVFVLGNDMLKLWDRMSTVSEDNVSVIEQPVDNQSVEDETTAATEAVE